MESRSTGCLEVGIQVALLTTEGGANGQESLHEATAALAIAAKAALYLFTQAGCADDPTLLSVTLTGLTPEISAVRIAATLNGVRALAPVVVPNSGDHYLVELNPREAGTLTLDAAGINGSSCPLVEGSMTTSENPDIPLELTLPLHAPSASAHWVKQLDGALDSLFVLDNSNVWAVGTDHSVQKWDGKTWSLQETDKVVVKKIWASDANNAWGIDTTDCIVAQWNGTAWGNSNLSLACYKALWGSDANHVWFVGDGGAIDMWDGANLLARSTSNLYLYAVWGTDPANVWAVGDQGTIVNANYDHPIRTYTDLRMEMSCRLPGSPT